MNIVVYYKKDSNVYIETFRITKLIFRSFISIRQNPFGTNYTRIHLNSCNFKEFLRVNVE